MKYLNIHANNKYTIIQQEDGEVEVYSFNNKIKVSDPGVILSLALTIQNLQDMIEIYKKPIDYV